MVKASRQTEVASENINIEPKARGDGRHSRHQFYWAWSWAMFCDVYSQLHPFVETENLMSEWQSRQTNWWIYLNSCRFLLCNFFFFFKHWTSRISFPVSYCRFSQNKDNLRSHTPVFSSCGRCNNKHSSYALIQLLKEQKHIFSQESHKHLQQLL